MAKHLEVEIKRLNKRILDIGDIVVEAIHKALTGLQDRDPNLAREVLDLDRRIDRAEVEVEEECLKVLALHQPVAEDLRFIAAVMKINNDLERMGDEAVNISEHAIFLGKSDPIPVPTRLHDMAVASMRMVKESLESFVNGDNQSARRICIEDDIVDEYNREVIDEVWKMMKSNPATIERGSHLFSVSRHLERIADHATNIAEDVVYMVEGKIIRHRAESYSHQKDSTS
ncbi:MAG: phosphate transport system regulatory protein PhoU [Acidobacteria bacterium RIFCSPLOWO2_12_FULL_54_10]|nr:MAG: phosphate transport system regulatory protein PhoU [Acidobacteria bacterium RIFCSPLOWO2_12_FULL_54_10]